MDFQKLTLKSQEAIGAAMEDARRRGNPEIYPEQTEAAKEHLAEAGWDPAYGARPLKRALQRLVENELAKRLLEGEFAEGDTILVDARDGELVFEKAAAIEAATAA